MAPKTKFFSFILAITAFTNVTMAAPKQAIICKKSELFDETMSQINGLMLEPQWPMEMTYTRDNSTKTHTSFTIDPKSFVFDNSNIRYFETKEKITEGKGKAKKTREATMYNACVPVEFQ